VPGRASGKGGMAATLGQDGGAALRPLAVDFHESGFVAGLAREDAFTQAQGFRFQLTQTSSGVLMGRRGGGGPTKCGPATTEVIARPLDIAAVLAYPNGHYSDSYPSGSVCSCPRAARMRGHSPLAHHNWYRL